ncbi:MAG: hypothetical protein AAFQ57_01285 [Cyanobacteria bacterium J06626_14]
MNRPVLLPILFSLFVNSCSADPTVDPLIGRVKQDTPSANCQLNSIDGDQEVSIQFVNTSKRAVAIYWLDYEGEEVFYYALQGGRSYDLQTYVTHPWCIRDAETGESITTAIVTSTEPRVVYIP